MNLKIYNISYIMEKITKSSINRIARRAGVKSISDDCCDTIRNLIGMELNNIIKIVLLANSRGAA